MLFGFGPKFLIKFLMPSRMARFTVRSRQSHRKISHFSSLTLFSLLLLSGGLSGGVLSSCGKGSQTPVTDASSPTIGNFPTLPSPANSASPSPAASSTNQAENYSISANGIGAAQLGMTYKALKQTLGAGVKFTVKAPFIVDFDAIAVQKGDQVLYYILYLQGESFSENDVIQGLITDNPRFRTAEGIGPGTTIANGEKSYGKATLSYNTENESREYVRFERQPASNISFGTGNGNRQLAGTYASPGSSYNETQSYRADAKIQSALVVCLSESCAPSPSPSPSP